METAVPDTVVAINAQAEVRDPGDAIVRITTSTICGTDLHIMKDDVPV